MTSERDPGPGGASNVVPEELFRYLLDLEVEKAARLRYCVSVLCLSPDLERGDGRFWDPLQMPASGDRARAKPRLRTNVVC